MPAFSLRQTLLIAVAFSTPLTAKAAQTAPQSAAIVAACQNLDGKATAEQRITSCTLLLRSTNLQPDGRAHVYLNRAWALTVEKKWPAALKDYDAAIKVAPKLAIAYSEKGFARLRMRQYDMAIQNYNKAIAIDPKTAYSWFGRGIAKIHQNNKQEGMNDIGAARKLDPQVDATFAKVGFKL